METTIIRNWQNAVYLWDRLVSMTTFSFVFLSLEMMGRSCFFQ